LVVHNIWLRWHRVNGLAGPISWICRVIALKSQPIVAKSSMIGFLVYLLTAGMLATMTMLVLGA